MKIRRLFHRGKRGPFNEERRKARRWVPFTKRERIYLASTQVGDSLDRLFGVLPRLKLTY